MTTKRAPYFIQIGFDFGTAFSKCIFRDVGADRAFVYQPETVFDPQLPFLVPVLLKYENRKVSNPAIGDAFHKADHLSLLKMALLNVVQERYSDPAVTRCKKVLGCKTKLLRKRVESATAYYLALRFVEIYSGICKRYQDFGLHPDDSIFLNVAIPIAGADNDELYHTFQRIVQSAWIKRDELVQSGGDLGAVAHQLDIFSRSKNNDDTCYIYPEVSANVQSYVRSRTARPGVYLFVDTGAGTVDHSVFHFTDHNGAHLSYLGAEVRPLGSSQIELRASKHAAGQGDIEYYRETKEAGKLDSEEIRAALDSIALELESPTLKCLGETYKKGFSTNSMIGIRLIYAGGGHMEDPYAQGVQGGVSEFFLLRDTGGCFGAGGYKTPFQPENIPEMGIPIPADLEIPRNANKSRWFKRLSVAYGLSFPRFDLADYKLPHEVHDMKPLKRTKFQGNEYIEN